jgi:hypothetical protein
MPAVKNLEGQRFGRLLVIRRGNKKGFGASWLCRCDCGNEKDATSHHLIQGNTRSCGCLLKPKKR